MLYGVDISNWQSGLVPADLRKFKDEQVDFCICKATEGIDFTDIWCDRFIQNCIDNNILFGFYHFATHGGDAKAEAIYFYNECKGYFGKGIPVLDYEVDNANDIAWCETWLQYVHDLSGVWPMLYISASRCADYTGSWIPSKCGLWVAGYPQTYTDWPVYANEYGDVSHYVKRQTGLDDFNIVEMPYNISPWEFAAIWQFTSELILPGYVGKLDGDVAYMDKAAWGKYAGNPLIVVDNPMANTKPSNELDNLAFDVILGKYGRGKERKKLLGDNYKAVQERVNELYAVANRVIDGYWGNDDDRRIKLEAAGYPYVVVQYIVNMFLTKEWG